MLGRLFGQREPHLEKRVPWLRRDLNVTSMLFHNSLHGVEAEAGAFSNSFGGEERLKDVRLYCGRDSRSIVSNLNHDAPVVAISSNSQLTFPAHRINGIVDQVGPYLIELAAK